MDYLENQENEAFLNEIIEIISGHFIASFSIISVIFIRNGPCTLANYLGALVRLDFKIAYFETLTYLDGLPFFLTSTILA